VTRNVKFNKISFYKGNSKEDMPVKQVTQIINALYNRELINAAEELDITLPSYVLADQNLELTTNNYNLGGVLNNKV
jgi:hypothetical protein